MKVTTAQKQRAMDKLGFIQGGRFMRSQQLQARMGGRPNAYLPTSSLGNRRMELKCVDLNVDLASGSVPSTTNTNAGIALVNPVQPGTGSWNRIGKIIKMKSFRYKMIIQCINPATAQNKQNTIRITLIYDKNPNSGAIPTFDTIFGSTSQTGTESTQSFLDNQRVDNTGRFIILKDDVIDSQVWAQATATFQSEWQCTLDNFVKLKGLQTIYSGQSNPVTIADISTGALYLSFRCEDNTANSDFTIKNSVCRLRYYD